MTILQCLSQKSKYPRFVTILLSVCFILLEFFSYTAVAAESISEDTASDPEDKTVSEASAIYIPSETLGDIAAPKITAEGAILMDAGNCAVLYQKNMDNPYFPASITKIMTCLLAVENSSLSDTVKMSNEAVFGIDRTSSNVGLDVGQSITMEEAILCVMLASANEAASAIAEHVSGSIEDFVDLMNKRAEELGCTHTHFENANGLPNDNHYVSPHDMALIARAFNDNETCRRLASMRTYDIAPTSTQPDEIHLLNHHKMYEGLSYAYDPVVWGKTGYTMAAGATLVTVAENNGLTLICVVMKDETERNYTDTRSLFDFGFSNYTKVNIAENDSHYNMNEADFFQTKDTTFGETGSFISLDPSGYVILPDNTPFSSLDSNIIYLDDPKDSVLAEITYELNGIYAGKCSLLLDESRTDTTAAKDLLTGSTTEEKITYVDITKYLPYAGITIALILIIILFIHIIKVYNIGNAMTRRRDIRKRRKRYHSDFDDINF